LDQQWAREFFGPEHAGEIAEIIREYTRFNGRRKPELLSPFTYSLVNYNEAERIVEEYNSLAERAGKDVSRHLCPQRCRMPYFHLVPFPVRLVPLLTSCMSLQERMQCMLHREGQMLQKMADRTEQLVAADTALMGYYNRVYAGGRWKHFMDQSHLGYIAWNDPLRTACGTLNLKPAVPDTSLGAIPAVAVEGSAEAWPGQ
jgi:hypothetical protein